MFFLRNVTRNRAAIGTKNGNKVKNKKNWSLKVALRPPGVFLVELSSQN